MGHARHDALARCSERQRDDLVEQALDLREEAVDNLVAHAAALSSALLLDILHLLILLWRH